MGYTEAVYYMLNGGLDKYIIEQLEVTDTWKHDFIAPGYASQSTELCVGWDEVTVEVPTTPSVTITEDSTDYPPTSPSKGYKQVVVSIAVANEKTVSEIRTYNFKAEDHVEGYKTVRCDVPIKGLDTVTTNHITKTYPDGSYWGVSQVNVKVPVYDPDAVDRLTEEIEEDCEVDPTPGGHKDPPPIPVPPKDTDYHPIKIGFPPLPKFYVTDEVWFEIHDEYANPTGFYTNPYTVELYLNGSDNPPTTMYCDMCIFVRWWVKEERQQAYIHHDQVLSIATDSSMDATTHGRNYRTDSSGQPNVPSGAGIDLYPGYEVLDFTVEAINNQSERKCTVYIHVLENEWQYGWGTWVWAGENAGASPPRTAADCTYERTSTFAADYYFDGDVRVDWRV